MTCIIIQNSFEISKNGNILEQTFLANRSLLSDFLQMISVALTPWLSVIKFLSCLANEPIHILDSNLIKLEIGA